MTAATAAEQPREHRPRSRALRAHQLDPRDNSLNAVRLVLALLVLVAHSYYIAGVGKGPELHGENLGGFAVFGFFTISGYLITGSRFTNGFATYLVHRLARLMPAFWVCLVVVVTFFAPIGFWRAHGTLEGYLTTPRTPLDHLVSNWFLRISFFDVAGTPTGVPYPGAWNGSLWSLYVEFICYLIIGALGFVAIVRRSALVMGVLFAGSVYAQAHSATLMSYFGGNGDAFFQIKLLPFFLGGALLYMVRDRVPLHWAGAAVAAAVTAVLVVLVEGWGMQAAAPFAVYVILWVASVVPSPRLVQRHDISYGVYIYAFPVQQLLVALDLHTHGFLLYNVLAALVTVPFAVASWLLVERPVMRRARRATSGPAHPGAPVTVAPVSLDDPRTAGPVTSGPRAAQDPATPDPATEDPATHDAVQHDAVTQDAVTHDGPTPERAAADDDATSRPAPQETPAQAG